MRYIAQPRGVDLERLVTMALRARPSVDDDYSVDDAESMPARLLVRGENFDCISMQQ